MDTNSTAKRGMLVGGVLLLWLLGIMWTLDSKGIVRLPGGSSSGSGPFAEDEPTASAKGKNAQDLEGGEDEEPVSEIVLKGGPTEAELAEQARLAALAAQTDEQVLPEEDQGPPTYPVWFESERDIGVCKISYEGGSRTANLHVTARLPEGRVSFSYRCGKYSGRGSIDVKTNRVNGVLFCKRGGDVTVQTVRSKDGRCGR
ncbi:MAG: hypothetical protein KC431_13780 [Myxococcales bacterium]|nr:hypothetical protein [Myxococcales bacterium]